MEKLPQQTPDLTQQNIDRIATLFPSAITETKDANGKLKKAINFTILKQLLSADVVDGDECYEFTWVGKKQSIIEGNKPIRKTLRPAKEESKNWDTTENLYIEGDNLEVLKLLQNSYLGGIKMMYFDPPYNTGNDFVYRDNFAVSKDDYEGDMGVFDDEDNRLFKNSETNGRFHSDWCSMMYPRLQLARNLLKDDGIIFISIDDNEVDNLKKICNEVFGEDSFLNQISVKSKPSSGASGGGEDKKLKKNVEYLLCYTKKRESFEKFNDIYETTDLMSFIEAYRNEGKSWKYTRALISIGNKSLHAETVDGSGETIKIYKHSNVIIKTISDLMVEEKLSEEQVYFKYFDRIFRDTNAQSSIRQRVIESTDNEDTFYSIEYLPRSGRNKGVLTTLYYKGRNKDLLAWLSDVAFKEGNIVVKKDRLGTLWANYNWNNVSKEGDIVFPNGKKPIAFIIRMIELCASETKDDIIMDFFSGSASTAHAVMQSNVDDDGNRKFIMVQYAEPCDEKSEAYKSGYKNICEIGKERIRRAGKKIEEELQVKSKNGGLFSEQEEIKSVDTGFRVLKLDDTNMKDVYYSAWEYNQQMLLDLESNIKEDRTDLDLLFGVMLDWGVPLSLPHITENIGGKQVHFVKNTDLVACFEENITENVVREIAKRKPLRVVFRDSSFGSSPEKINVSEIFKTLSGDTTIKVI